MIKIFLVTAVVLTLAMFIFASCNNRTDSTSTSQSASGLASTTNSDAIDDVTTSKEDGKTSTSQSASNPASTTSKEDSDMLEKLNLIKRDWTEEQVHTLLGTPDRDGGLSVVAQDIYNVSDTTEAIISYWSEGLYIQLHNSETGEKTTILG